MMAEEHAWRSRGTVMAGCLLIIIFFLLCIGDRLSQDWQSGQWQSMATRLALVAAASVLLAWRLGRALAPAGRLSLRQGGLCLVFIVFLSAPLLSQLPFLSRSIADVGGAIAAKETDLSRKILAAMRQFSGAYEEYVRLHFAKPEWLIHLNALIKIHLFAFSPNTNITVGKEGFYFEGMGANRVEGELVENFDNIADYMGQIPFSDSELREWKIALEQRAHWLREQGVDYVFVLAPTKALVYPEYLPERIQRVRGEGRYEQLARYLRSYADVHFVDLLPALLAEKARTPYPLLFYKTDFHWNFFGAFVAYKTICEHLQHFFPERDFSAPDLGDFEQRIDRRWAHERFMYTLGLPLAFHRNEHHVTMVPRPGGRYAGALDLPAGGISDEYPDKRRITAADGASMDIRLLRNPQAPVPSLLLLGDSFLEKCIFFFSANAQRVLNYRTVVNFPKEILHFERPDVVIQEILNMYLLRPPPKNPQRLQLTYFRKKFADHPDRVVLQRQVAAAITGKSGTATIRLEAPPAMPSGELWTARLSLPAGVNGKPVVRMLDGESRLVATRPCEPVSEEAACFFDLPSETIRAMAVDFGSAAAASGAGEFAVEVRTDGGGI